MSDSDIVLKGAALKAAVRAAETPLLGKVVKRQLLRDLELDTLQEVDLRDFGSPAPASAPHHLPPHGEPQDG